MLWLEQCVVAALAGADDLRTDGAISEFVRSSFAAMPQHLRLGVAGESLVLGAWVRVRHGSQPSPDSMRRALSSWEHSPVGVIRQYARLLSSLVIFAQQETLES